MAYKILTVDDSKTIRMIVKKAFKPYNCELYEGENGGRRPGNCGQGNA